VLACACTDRRAPRAELADEPAKAAAFAQRYTMLTTTVAGAKNKRLGETVEVDAKEPIPRDWQGLHACEALSELVGGRFECVRAQRWACEDGDDSPNCFQRVPCERPATSFEPDPKHLATARAECRRVAPP
jgi:hypothetical protein